MSLSDFDPGVGLSKLPKARTSEIVVQDVDDELLIYNLKTNEAHHLNKTISMVWQNCDGKTSYAEMSAILSRELGEEVEADFVWIALKELEKIELLGEIDPAGGFENLSRRKVLFKYALPAIAVPIVVSLVTPASAAQVQGSCLGENESDCFNPATPCCPGLICASQDGVVAPGVCIPSPVPQ